MDNILINNIFKNISIKYNYLGIFSIKDLSNLNINLYENFSLILFIENISPKLGHWVSVFKIKNKIFFLDSFGFHPNIYKINLKKIFKINKEINFYFLKYRLQGDNTTTCGAYAVHFINRILSCDYSIYCFITLFFKGFS